MVVYFQEMADSEWYSLEAKPVQFEPQEIIPEAPEITDGCPDCNDEDDAPDCTDCEASNAGSREHPHLCDVCNPTNSV